MNHYPTPWRVCVWERIIEIVASNDLSVAQVRRHNDGPARLDEVALANADLLSKAPEVGEASRRVAELEEAMRKIRAYAYKPGDPDDHITLKGVLADIQREACALLGGGGMKKADGEQKLYPTRRHRDSEIEDLEDERERLHERIAELEQKLNWLTEAYQKKSRRLDSALVVLRELVEFFQYVPYEGEGRAIIRKAWAAWEGVGDG